MGAIADEETFDDLSEIFEAGVKGEAARRSDPTEPLARLVRVSSAAVPEVVARREAADVFFRRACRDDDRAQLNRLLDADEAVYWVADDSATLPSGVAFVAEGGAKREEAGCLGIVVDWEVAERRVEEGRWL